jgi:hypothetical protein
MTAELAEEVDLFRYGSKPCLHLEAADTDPETGILSLKYNVCEPPDMHDLGSESDGPTHRR